MKRFLLQHIFILAFCLLVGTVFFVVPSVSYAQDFVGAAKTAYSWFYWLNPTNWGPMILYVVAYAVFGIAAGLVTLVGLLLDLTVQLNAGLVHSTIAMTGWLVVRNFANLAIVVSVIFVAVAMIVGREEYKLKDFLAKLVVMALLINFTFVISGLFVDFGSVFTNFFLEKIMGSNATSSFSATMNSALGLPSILGNSAIKQDPGTEIALVLGKARDLFFVDVFLIIASAILANVAVLYLIRYFFIVALLILAPLAWILYAFPGLEHLAKQWWKTFLEWIFFLPVSMFFIYLAALSMINFAGVGGEFAKANALAIREIGSLSSQSFGESFTRLLFGFGFLLTAMMAGKFVGGGAAEVGFSMAGKMKGVLTGATAGVGGFALSRYLNRQVQTKDEKGNLKTMSRADAWKLGLTKRGYAGAANIIGGMAGGYSERAGQYKEKYAGLSKQEIANVANAGGIMLDEERLAIAQRLGETHAWGSVDDARKQEFLAAARSQKDRHAILAENPELAATAEEAHDLAAHYTSGQIAKLGKGSFDTKTFGGLAVVQSLDRVDLEALSREGNKDGLRAAIEGVGSRIEDLRKLEQWNEHEQEEVRRLNNTIDSLQAPGSLLRYSFQQHIKVIPEKIELAVEIKKRTEAVTAEKAAADRVAAGAREATEQATRNAVEEAERKAEEERTIGKD